ncbi:MAG: MarR family transcriptional regulator [Pseudomonadota bacterium]
MADIKISQELIGNRPEDRGRETADDIAGRPRPASGSSANDPAIAYEMIELLFFAYRDFISDADQVLSAYGYGRAHHRVLHFVSRHPGLTVAELLDILKITKQSLARVLKPLIEDGFIIQQTGKADRRQRLLHVTDKGRDLALRLAKIQTDRLTRALAEAGMEHEAAAKSVLRHIINRGEQGAVQDLIGSGIDPSRLDAPANGEDDAT